MENVENKTESHRNNIHRDIEYMIENELRRFFWMLLCSILAMNSSEKAVSNDEFFLRDIEDII